MPNNVIGVPPQINWLGRLDKYAENVSGSLTNPTVLIAQFQVPTIPDAGGQNQGNVIRITDFAATCDGGGINSRFFIQKAANNAGVPGSWITAARIVLPAGGNYHRTYARGIFVANAQWCRVVFYQDTVAYVSAEIKGETAQSDLVDV
jgi:hypothetical protein